MKKKILVGLLLAGSTMFAAPRVSFGVSIGAPGPVVVAPPMVAAVPRALVPATYSSTDIGVSSVASACGTPGTGAHRNMSRILTGTPSIFAASQLFSR